MRPRTGKETVYLEAISEEWTAESFSENNLPSAGERVGEAIPVVESPWVFEGPEVDAMVREWILNPESNGGVRVSSDLGIHWGLHHSGERAPKITLRIH